MADLELLTGVVCDATRELVVVDDTTPAPAGTGPRAFADGRTPLDEVLVEPAHLDGVSTVVLRETHLMTAPRWGGSWPDLCWLGGVLPGFYSDDDTPGRIETMANAGAALVMADARALLDAPDHGARWLTNIQRFGMIAALDLRPSAMTAEQLATATERWTDAGATLDHCVAVASGPGPLHGSRVAGHRPAPRQLASPG